jgi:hypothetical protein
MFFIYFLYFVSIGFHDVFLKLKFEFEIYFAGQDLFSGDCLSRISEQTTGGHQMSNYKEKANPNK